MKFLDYAKHFKIPNLINFSKNFLKNKLISIRYFKKRHLIREISQSEVSLKKYIPSNLNIEKLRNIFFNKQLFAYSNLSEKPKIIEFLKQECAIKSNNYIKYADKIIEREFSIFEKKIKFKNKINWHFSLLNNFYWKLEKSEKIDIRPRDKGLDVKYVWELNRHNFLPYLGYAFYLTNDERYVKEFKEIILDWIRENPPLYGINWYSGLEISIRLISWIFTLYFFKNSKEINNDDFFEKIFNSMFIHALYLRYFYTRHSFNHTVGDLFGVYFFSKIFEEIKSLKKWENKFFKKFKDQIFLQTRPDGTNIEQSVNYHRFVLEFFSLFIILNPNSLNEEEKNLIDKMYDYLLYIIKPNGTFPLTGDSDDGKSLFLSYYEENLFDDLINLGTILFRRTDLKNISKTISPISVLLMGIEGSEIYQKIRTQEPNEKFKFFNNAGYITLRNDWTDESNYIFVDYGRFGPFHCPHSHSSVTNLIFSFKGKDILIDSGTYTYNKSWEDRNIFRGSKAHNILVIDEKNQAKIANWFGWENKPKIKRKIRIINNNIKLECLHDGYNGFLVKRTINVKKNLKKIIINDSVFQTEKDTKENLHDICIYFHFNKDLDIRIENNKVIIDNKLNIKVFSDQSFKLLLENSFYSPKYGTKYKNKVLKVCLKHNFTNKKTLEVLTEITPTSKQFINNS